MAIAKRTPLQELDLMERRMRRFFDDVGFAPGFLPPADVFETEKEFVVELEVPGFTEDRLAVEQTDHVLTVKGEREDAIEKQERAFHLHERLERSFERRFRLPPEVDTKHLKGSFHEGVLTIRAPKRPDATPHRVPITH
jgi:HSP20 family protein